jgi:hypothetical protein
VLLGEAYRFVVVNSTSLKEVKETKLQNILCKEYESE